MRWKIATSYLVIAIVFAAIGWFAHSVETADNLTPGESVFAAWQTQLNTLTDLEGATRSPEEIRQVAEVTFDTLSIALALQYDHLSDEQKRSMAPLIARAKVLGDRSTAASSLGVLGCIEAAGVDSPIGTACIFDSVKTNK